MRINTSILQSKSIFFIVTKLFVTLILIYQIYKSEAIPNKSFEKQSTRKNQPNKSLFNSDLNKPLVPLESYQSDPMKTAASK